MSEKGDHPERWQHGGTEFKAMLTEMIQSI